MPPTRRIRIPNPLPIEPLYQAPPPPLPAPLTWWRQLPPAAFDLAAQQILRAALLDRLPPKQPIFAAARDADPAAAVRVALAPRASVPTRSDGASRAEDSSKGNAHDAALSIVLLCAAQGDAACAVVLAHALDQRARSTADLTTLCLARSWRRPATAPLGVSAVPAQRR